MSAVAERFSDNAGWRATQVARSTGRPVSIYDGTAAELDTAGGRWQTVCEDHGFIVSHDTLRLARWHASAPESWCGVCSGHEPDGGSPVPHCPHGCGALRWADDQWFCPYCSGEFAPETFTPEKTSGGTPCASTL